MMMSGRFRLYASELPEGRGSFPRSFYPIGEKHKKLRVLRDFAVQQIKRTQIHTDILKLPQAEYSLMKSDVKSRFYAGDDSFLSNRNTRLDKKEKTIRANPSNPCPI